MRLDNKLKKVLKFILKLFVFLPIIFTIINFFSYELNDGNVNDIDLGALMGKLFDYSNTNGFFEFESNISIFTNFNHWAVRHFFNSQYGVGFYTLIIFEWWIFVDLLDLVFSGFRFIIDFGSNLIDSFLEKTKRGGK